MVVSVEIGKELKEDASIVRMKACQSKGAE
jgi:hypothetical protein